MTGVQENGPKASLKKMKTKTQYTASLPKDCFLADADCTSKALRLDSFDVTSRYDGKKELKFILAGDSEDMGWTLNILTDFLKKRFQWKKGEKPHD